MDPNDVASSAVLVPPDFLAYQAMAHHRLGELQETQAALELMRKSYEMSSMLGVRRFGMADETGYSHPARLREAEALILGPPPELPEDVFTHWPGRASDGGGSSTVHVGSPQRLSREAPDVTGTQPIGSRGEIGSPTPQRTRRQR
jgi:hypothetical protein